MPGNPDHTRPWQRHIWCSDNESVTRKQLLRRAGKLCLQAGTTLILGGQPTGCRHPASGAIRLAFNENPLGPSAFVLKAIEEALHKPLALTGINRYADFLPFGLTGVIARHHGLVEISSFFCCSSKAEGGQACHPIRYSSRPIPSSENCQPSDSFYLAL